MWHLGALRGIRDQFPPGKLTSRKTKDFQGKEVMVTQLSICAGAGVLALPLGHHYQWRRQHGTAPLGRMLMVKRTQQDAYALMDLAGFHQLLQVPGLGTQVKLIPHCQLFSTASALRASLIRRARS